MNKIEIKRIEGKTLFKATLYIGCVPAAILILIGVIMLLVSSAIESGALTLSAFYLIFCGIIYTVIGGLIYWFLAFMYNTFAKHFGGIKMEININDTKEIEIQNQ